MPALLERGALELASLEGDGRPLAAIYGFIWDNKLHYYQSGRMMDAPAKARIGVSMHVYALRDAICRGLREYIRLSRR
jgi:hypothetical protein